MKNMRALRLFLLMSVFLLPGMARGEEPKRYTVTPEVQYYKVIIEGRHLGYWRDEYRVLPEGRYRFEHEDKIILPGLVSTRRSAWEFDDELRPHSFTEETIDETPTRKIARNAGGRIDHDRKVIVFRKQLVGQGYWTETDLPLPDGLMADGASDLVLANARLAPGQTYRFRSFVPRLERDDELTLVVKERDPKTGAYWLHMKSRESPAVRLEYLFQPARRETPNGRVLKGIFEEGALHVEVLAASREEATRPFEPKRPVPAPDSRDI